TKQTLVRWEKNGGSPVKYYEISVPGTGSNAGKIVFEFNTQSTGSGEITTCVSNNAIKRVDDGNWHHVVAVRKDGSGNPQQKCELYIDGILHSSVQSPHNTPNMEADGKWYVGSNRAENADFFKGRIDDIIHWNSKALDATEVLDLFKTSYGENAHKVTFKIDKTDKDGNLIQNLRTNSSYPLDFLDGDGKYNSPSAADWKWFNFTTPTIDSASLTNQRIRFNMTFNHPLLNNGELDMKLRIDDVGVTSGLGSSFLQIPMPDQTFPGYYTYDNDNFPLVTVVNNSPNGAWISFLTRAVFDSLDTSSSYGALIKRVDTTTLSASNDSPFFVPSMSHDVEFDKPYAIPGSSSSGIVPPGRYKLNVFLSGYDEYGLIYLQTSYIGVVRVVD
ncbi:MAG TPA: LamG-like jellyroll fold domain-containing protein, partial [Nitrosopumilaceae archaeon]|nr:LamG-like jellyroll fold domain-containing protein [Nitrosopumilaceae archaeon]